MPETNHIEAINLGSRRPDQLSDLTTERLDVPIASGLTPNDDSTIAALRDYLNLHSLPTIVHGLRDPEIQQKIANVAAEAGWAAVGFAVETTGSVLAWAGENGFKTVEAAWAIPSLPKKIGSSIVNHIPIWLRESDKGHAQRIADEHYGAMEEAAKAPKDKTKEDDLEDERHRAEVLFLSVTGRHQLAWEKGELVPDLRIELEAAFRKYDFPAKLIADFDTHHLLKEDPWHQGDLTPMSLTKMVFGLSPDNPYMPRPTATAKEPKPTPLQQAFGRLGSTLISRK